MKKIYIGILTWSICFSSVGIVNAIELNSVNTSSEEMLESESKNDSILNEEEIEINIDDNSKEFTKEQTEETNDSSNMINDDSVKNVSETSYETNKSMEHMNESNTNIGSTQNESCLVTEDDSIASGTNSSGMSWKLYEDGLLEIGGGAWASYNIPWSQYIGKITRVIVTDKILPNGDIGFDRMFYQLSNVTNIEGLDLLETADSISFKSTFEGCTALETLDLSSFNTSNAQSMARMFYGCTSLKILDLSSFRTANVLSMNRMFAECKQIVEINLSSFNTSSNKDFEFMFSSNVALKNLDVSHFNTKSATTLYGMFYFCTALEIIDVRNFDTSNVINMGSLFGHCRSVRKLDLSNFDTSNVTSMEGMFYYNWNLQDVNLSSFNVEKVTDFSGFMNQAKSIKELDLSNFLTTSIRKSYGAFQDMDALNKLYIPNWKNDTDNRNFIGNSPISELRVGASFRLEPTMFLRQLDTNEVWVDSSKEELSTVELIEYHNSRGIEDVYHVEKQYTLTFDTKGGSNVPNQKKIAGKLFEKPVSPVKDGFIFNYWSLDVEGKQPYDFSTPISENIKLYANYTPEFIVTIPSRWDLNIDDSLLISAENYIEDRDLVVQMDRELELKNSGDEKIVIQKTIKPVTSCSLDNIVLEISGKGSNENKILLESQEENEPAGSYTGVISFKIYYK